MPVQYSGVIAEHTAVRTSCGLFDVSHMGEIECSGPGALAFVQRVITNDIERISDGQCQYTMLCYADGGVVDDCIVYRLAGTRFIFCVNASNTAKVFEWLRSQDRGGVEIEDVSGSYAQIALQGPASNDVLEAAGLAEAAGIRRFAFEFAEIAGVRAMVSRTGYTGEDGFEIYLAPSAACAAWDELMEAGAAFGILPVGLGARDTLRLEMGYPLYGHELDADTTPLEAGLGAFVALGKPAFSGREALVREKGTALKKRLVGFVMTGRGIPRQGYEIRLNGSAAGAVTSGTMSPSLGRGIGMGYVEARDGLGPGDELEVIIRNRAAGAIAATRPFYVKAAGGALA